MTAIIFLYYPIFLSLSISFFISFVVPAMMTLFKKGVHSVMGLPGALDATSATTEKLHLQYHHHRISSLAGGLGLVAATRDVERIPNVLESATVKPITPPSTPTAKRDHGGIGFIDDIGGGVDGLMSCTESLGFESSDERRVDDQIEEINHDKDEDGSADSLGTTKTTESMRNWRRPASYHQRRQVKSFPPPITSLNRNGQPTFFLRPVRKDGRLELTQVRINRPDILHASREDGRLRLHFIRDESFLDDLEQEEEEELQEEDEQLEEEEVAELEEEIGEEQEKSEISHWKDEENSERIGEWKFPMGSEGDLRRCHQVVNHHHHLHICGVSIV
ncbi:hypothetical protein L6164_035085 [Bauhinia variegata]|uniref:Uncharacterized protein n=1 Tax=Bauhinia variegata TaxID=167791 RepID=A0ACB9KX25_BAUVA|nr:hypothetical protein L6164_035085 [Bauhinia variegata]